MSLLFAAVLITISYTSSLFLDEPITGLDVHSANVVVKVLSVICEVLDRVVM